MKAHTYDPSAGKGGDGGRGLGVVPRVCWPAGLTESGSSRFSDVSKLRQQVMMEDT